MVQCAARERAAILGSQSLQLVIQGCGQLTGLCSSTKVPGLSFNLEEVQVPWQRQVVCGHLRSMQALGVQPVWPKASLNTSAGCRARQPSQIPEG